MNTEITPPKGRITVWSINEGTNEKTYLFEQNNLVMYTWANAVIQAAFIGDMRYKINAMYLEYYNVTNPSDTVSVPTYARSDGISYYSSLASPGDFLRVPLSSAPSVTIQSGYESYFTAPLGNVASFFAQSSGTTGIKGRAFANANNSKVFGVALVATPSWADYTQDVIFARSYFTTGNQQLKSSGAQIGVTWTIPLL